MQCIPQIVCTGGTYPANIPGSQVVCTERCCSKYHHAIHDLGLARKVKKECKETMVDKNPWNGF